MRKNQSFWEAAGRLAVQGAAAVAGVHLASALTLDRMLEYREVLYTSPRISPSLDGYTIAFLTDIHAYPEDKLKEAVSRINRRGVQLALLGGDYAGQRSLARCMRILGNIRACDGIYGVEGNNDDHRALGTAMRRQGMVLLENRGLRVREGLYLAGLEDLYNRSPDVAAAVAQAGGEDFVLLLCHNPDVSMLEDFSRVDLSLCGHTHGGEISLFGLWAPALRLVSFYGQTFSGGWSKSAAGSDVYVSNGIGRHAPLRVFARPQVILLTLKSRAGGGTAG